MNALIFWKKRGSLNQLEWVFFFESELQIIDLHMIYHLFPPIMIDRWIGSIRSIFYIYQDFQIVTTSPDNSLDCWASTSAMNFSKFCR